MAYLIYIVKIPQKLFFWILNWTLLRGGTYDEYCMKEHINLCRQGYIWHGGFFFGRRTACWHCNKDVAILEDMINDKKYSLELRVIMKDELEKAMDKRANINNNNKEVRNAT